ncbi:MAG TPA: cytochrome d ubiquinol oxidase subunit II [Solirubrobacteraceae bacterium]|nr:cytochrome d ubiquinol oxidase subunit II [Solirubrobacteraceae bacterium]
MIYVLPMIFVLIGLALYGILGGADFGAGFWQLTAGRRTDAERLRAHAHDSMAPVWEANHVWLIFVLTVTWTAYPLAFGSIASTLSVALAVAGLGIIFRGAAYALRTGTSVRREQHVIDTVFGVSSLITPFALGAAIGGIASGRVPVGNAAGSLFSSWLNPTSILIGALAVLTGAYLAAVFLSADAVRRGEPDLAERFRRRSLGAGVASGAVALGGLVVLHGDAPALFHGLVKGNGLPALIVSALAGAATLALVWLRRFEPARYAASLAVAAIVAGWALAQNPQLLPGLTVRQAAASYDTQVTLVVAVLAGAALLGPSLAALFRLALGGRLGEGAPAVAGAPVQAPRGMARSGLLVRLAAAFAVAGLGLMNVADAEWAHGIGALCYLGFIICGFRLALPLATASSP